MIMQNPLLNSSKRLKILYVSSHNPIGHEFGARMRVFNTAKILQKIAEVSLVLVVSENENNESINLAKKQFNLLKVFRLQRLKEKLDTRIRQEIDPFFLGIRRETISEKDKRLFREIKQKHDLVWFHTVRIPDSIGKLKWNRSILDVDDLTSQLYASRELTEVPLIRRILDLRMKWIWKRREKIFLNRFDILCVCSEKDKDIFNRSPRVYVVRNGFRLGAENVRKDIQNDFPMIGFIGGFNYVPNRKGVEWFIKEVWPLVKIVISNVRLRLIGQDTQLGISSYGDAIDGLGWIENPVEEIARWSALIVPIRLGGGTRIKIAEGFARKCPVISTSIGAYGYQIENGKEAIIADSPKRFADACIQIISRPELREKLTENAYKNYLKYHTWEAQEKSIYKAVEHCFGMTAESK